jgi:DNA-directed RNA polymerase subunit RPC12/RpoP
MTTIRINIDTFKTNPEYGRNLYIDNGTTYTLTLSSIPEFLKDGENCVIVSKNYDMIDGESFEVIIHKKELFDKIMESKDNVIKARSARDLIQLATNVPEFNYEYEDTLVKCNECEKEFNYSELKEYEEPPDYYTLTACPYCGKYDCCELEFESESSAIERIANKTVIKS